MVKEYIEREVAVIKTEATMIGRAQLLLSVLVILGSIFTTGILVTRYIDSIEREQALQKGRMDAFEKYGSSQARDAKTSSDMITVKQEADMKLITEKLYSIDKILQEVRSDVKKHIEKP